MIVPIFIKDMYILAIHANLAISNNVHFFLKQGAIIETQQKQTSITVNTAH
jgi:hypothetical protein